MEQEVVNGHPEEEQNEIVLTSREPAGVEEKSGKKSKEKKVESKNNNLSKLDVDNLLDAESMKTMDGCLKILAQLHVSEALEESE